VKVRKNGFGLFYDLLEGDIATVYCKADRRPWIRLEISLVVDEGDGGTD
ncbi:MAG: hypothetical protein GY800_13290, partial [Planctomycetes bacterium]|nr:hypothetical protein [Planctomycetota bacterium]